MPPPYEGGGGTIRWIVTEYIGVEHLAVESELEVVVVGHWFGRLASLRERRVLGRVTAHTHRHVVVESVHPADAEMRRIKRYNGEGKSWE